VLPSVRKTEEHSCIDVNTFAEFGQLIIGKFPDVGHFFHFQPLQNDVFIKLGQPTQFIDIVAREALALTFQMTLAPPKSKRPALTLSQRIPSGLEDLGR